MTLLFSLYGLNCYNIKYLYFNDSNFLLYEMVFTCYSAGKIWSSICIQDFIILLDILLDITLLD